MRIILSRLIVILSIIGIVLCVKYGLSNNETVSNTYNDTMEKVDLTEKAEEVQNSILNYVDETLSNL